MPTFPKRKYSPPNANDKIIVEHRIINGTSRKVETFKGKIVRVFGNKGNIIEDRSSDFGNELPLPPYVPKPKVEEILKIADDKKEEISKIADDEKEEMSGTESGIRIVSAEDTEQYSKHYIPSAVTPKSEDATSTDIATPKPEVVTNADIATPKPEDVTNADIATPKSEAVTNADMVTPKSEAVTNADIVTPKSEAATNADIVTPKPEAVTNADIVTTIPEEVIQTEVVTPRPEEVIQTDIVTPRPEEIIQTDVVTPRPEDTIYVPKMENIIPKIEIPKPEPQEEIHKAIDIPKKYPKKSKDVIPVANKSVLGRLSKIMEEKTKEDKAKSSNITKSEHPLKEIPKAEIPKEGSKETPKENSDRLQPGTPADLPDPLSQTTDDRQGKINKPRKEVKRMAEEEEEEIMQERKFEKWLKKNRFQENVEKTAKIAEENQGQIKDISNEITNVKDGLGGVENRIDNLKEGLNSILGETKKPITETLGGLCNDIDCIKNDVSKYVTKSEGVQSDLDKKLDTRFGELRERIQKLEEPTFTCDNCGADSIRPLSSFCSNCGSPIHSWNDDTGQPVRGWVPYWRRAQA